MTKTTPQTAYVHLDQRTPEHTNRIRYPRPNRLGLVKPAPFAEVIGGRVIDNGIPTPRQEA